MEVWIYKLEYVIGTNKTSMIKGIKLFNLVHFIA